MTRVQLVVVEAPGLHRDVAGRVVQAEEGLEVLAPVLGDDLAVPVLVEAVDHHPVVPGEVADLGRQAPGPDPATVVVAARWVSAARVARWDSWRRGGGRAGRVRPRPRAGHRCGASPPRPAAPPRLRAADATGEPERDAGTLDVGLGDRHVPPDRVGRALPEHRGQRRAQHGGDRPAEQLLGVARDDRHPPVGLVDAQEHPVRLDRPRDVDRLGVAVGRSTAVSPGPISGPPSAAVAGRAPAAAPARRASGRPPRTWRPPSARTRPPARPAGRRWPGRSPASGPAPRAHPAASGTPPPGRRPRSRSGG